MEIQPTAIWLGQAAKMPHKSQRYQTLRKPFCSTTIYQIDVGIAEVRMTMYSPNLRAAHYHKGEVKAIA